MAAQQQWDAELVAIAEPELLQQRARLLGLSIKLQTMDPTSPPTTHQPGILKIAPVKLATPAVPGKPDPANAPYVLATLQRAVD
ncbi:MAG: 4-hydroxythreonine-4-phosphate dehydrogenase, partial [Gammaproteobacteria bacterium]